MHKYQVWNILQFVVNPGLVSTYIIIEFCSQTDSTEEIIQINQLCFILQLSPWLSSQFTAACFIFYQYTSFNQYLIIYAFDQIFSSSLVPFIRSSSKRRPRQLWIFSSVEFALSRCTQ
ncbi:Hypothetical_protein [Hexamita inflata]|uniref:Hypothetical_protein n=1 Tax=Hexamita inflata TaxID=28002 RepID=A0AA86PJH7_9EUKA|nr:Hypothetical protein HINF_LOCUS27206 [Hexamita inflata]